MRAYLLCSLLIVSVVAAGCGDSKPGIDARDGAADGKGDGSTSNDRADVGGDKPTGTGGSTTGSAGTGGNAGTGTGGNAGTGGTSGNDGGVDTAADGGGNDGAAPTCSDGIKNSDETGIDCGGHCGKCGPGNACLVNTDCQYACRADKTCAACNVAADCPGVESECEHRTCTAGVCGSTREAAGTVLAVQSAGDCKRLQCTADGKVANVNDDTDVPDDRNACTNDICTTGTPSHTMMPANSNCGGANHCNTTGQCVGCTVAADCPGTDTACRTRTCTTGGVCGFSFVALGTKLVDPTAGDCKGLRCDGNGNEQVYNEDLDLPVDNNVCTTDECGSGTPSHRPVASGFVCGNGLVCDGASKCVACLSASTCPGTDAACHTRSCVSGACGVMNLATGTLVAAQTPRDCKKDVCNGQGGVTTVNDDLDLPVDNNVCTADVCTAGTPTNPNVTAGNSCGTNTICDGQGACVTCLTASSCPGTDTECHHRTCTNGACGVANTAAGTALSTQTAGDCKRSQCDGSGGSVIVNDDADKPVDGNTCTDDVCTAGVPTNPKLSTGTGCGTNLMCNAQGMCVGCITAANCGTDTTCQTHTCSAAGVCGVTNATAGTVLPAQNQTAGDCKRVQCDGQGQSTTVTDDSDKPVDGNACTKDLCSGGVGSNPPEDSGTTCSQSNGTRCNGSGSAPACVQCLQPTDCTGTDTECHHRTCTNGVCGIANTPDGTLVQSQTAADCKKNVCMGGAQVPANDDTDVPVDGNGCTNDLCTAGVPSHTPVGIDVSCSEGGGTRCNGAGACVACTAAIQCGNNSFCQTFTCSAGGQCVPNPTANGTPLPPASQIAGDCQKKVCNGAGVTVELVDNADVIVDGNACTADLCNNGVPVNPSLAPGDPCSQGNGSMCNGSATAPACVQCVTNANCGTDTTCETFSCSSAGQCSSTPRNEGVTVSDVPGDCHKDVCMSGAVTTVIDNNDVLVDGNPCTDDKCSNGVATNPNVTAGMSCGTNQMCNGSGACVGCIADANCPTGNACQVPVCKAGGICDFTNVAEFTALTDDSPGDCHHKECDGAGGIRTIVDPNDTPSTNGSECMQGTCNGGAPAVIPRASGYACTQDMGMECDGAGQCVHCISPSECPGDDNECSPRTCLLGVCGTQLTPDGTAVTAQTSGDCSKSVCDGMGFTKTIADNGDAPAPTNECMTPTCSAGSVTQTPKAHGTTCTVNGRTCNGSGSCINAFTVLRIDGTSSSAAAINIEEHQLDGTLLTTTPLPTANAGSNLSIVDSGSASSDGSLSLSGDGRYLIVAGYNSTVGTANVATAAGINRVVARIDAAGTVNSTTSISSLTAFTTNNVRGATSQDGTGFWVGGNGTGSTGGIWFVSLGGSGLMNVLNNPNNTRWPHVINGQLYSSASTGSVFNNVFTVGTGLPTSGPQTAAVLPGMPASGPSPFSFVLFDRDSNGTFDTMYVSDDGNAANQGIQKWTFGTTATCSSTPCWTRVATYNLSPVVDFKGVAGYMAADGTSVTLMATTDEGTTSRLVRIDEVFSPTPSVTVTAVGSSPAGQMYRGITLAPHL